MSESPERRASPLLSNNPFRNRTISPPNSLPSPSSPNFRVASSNNPFLDSSEQTRMNGRTSPEKPAYSGNTVDLFSNLNLDDKKSAPLPNPSIRRPENLPPRSDRIMPPPGHRPTRSRDEEERRRRDDERRAAPKNNDSLDIFADPVETKSRPRQRARRNSDTSLVDRNSRSLETEEERRKRKHKEREARRRNGSSTKPKVPGHRLDVIDKLDVTSIFGTGVFHHDGPFDACNPNRNRKGLRAAPMAAFPKDSANMAIGGSGPVNKDINHAQYHGAGAEGYSDYATSGAVLDNDVGGRPRYDDKGVMFEAAAKVEPIHGPETTGLGTSTFLEGAPASRAAIARRESENEAAMSSNGMNGGGLSRTKSLAQRIRGISNGRPAGMSGRMNSPEPKYPLQRSMTQSPPLVTPSSIGGGNNLTESNPFFQDYDKEYEKKGVRIALAEGSGSRAGGMSSPKREVPSLERTITNDGVGGGEPSKPASGFLSRVKSLKGGPRRVRAERSDVS